MRGKPEAHGRNGSRAVAKDGNPRYIQAMTSTTLDELVGVADLEEFGKLPTEERTRQALARPELPGAMRSIKIANAVSKAHMRRKMAEVLDEQLPTIKTAFAELAAANPKVYLDQVMAFAEFSLPKLKSVEVDVSANSESARDLSIAQLQAALADSEQGEDNVVSVQ